MLGGHGPAVFAPGLTPDLPHRIGHTEPWALSRRTGVGPSPPYLYPEGLSSPVRQLPRAQPRTGLIRATSALGLGSPLATGRGADLQHLHPDGLARATSAPGRQPELQLCMGTAGSGDRVRLRPSRPARGACEALPGRPPHRARVRCGEKGTAVLSPSVPSSSS